jgi:hypothetical protein
MLGVHADAREDLADLADRVDRKAVRLDLLEVGASRRGQGKVLAPLRALEGARLPGEGPAITRPTACSPVMISRATAQAAYSSAGGHSSTWAAICSTESADV